MDTEKVVEGYRIEEKGQPTFLFVGVTTAQSSIMKVFPRWMEALNRPDVKMEGRDHALHDERETYRATVAQIKFDPQTLGALVTAHKIDVLEAAGDMFDELHPSAQLTGEVSCISKRDGRLIGHALDPLTGGMSLNAVLGERYFARLGGHVLCFGAGGAGKAISLHLMRKQDQSDRPETMIVVNRSQPRLDKLVQMVKTVGTDIRFETVCNEDPHRSDAIMAQLPDGSVVVNATGLGKDRPGSPVTNEGLFPRRGVAWELNYRGELDFWHQAMWQREARDLTVEDGWLYFLHGWSQHITQVLDLEMDESRFEALAELAEPLRPTLTPRPRPER
jgi:shikimate 5-dehydrogenase